MSHETECCNELPAAPTHRISNILRVLVFVYGQRNPDARKHILTAQAQAFASRVHQEHVVNYEAVQSGEVAPVPPGGFAESCREGGSGRQHIFPVEAADRGKTVGRSEINMLQRQASIYGAQ